MFDHRAPGPRQLVIDLESSRQMSGALRFDAVTNKKQRDQRDVVLEGLR